MSVCLKRSVRDVFVFGFIFLFIDNYSTFTDIIVFAHTFHIYCHLNWEKCSVGVWVCLMLMAVFIWAPTEAHSCSNDDILSFKSPKSVKTRPRPPPSLFCSSLSWVPYRPLPSLQPSPTQTGFVFVGAGFYCKEDKWFKWRREFTWSKQIYSNKFRGNILLLATDFSTAAAANICIYERQLLRLLLSIFPLIVMFSCYKKNHIYTSIMKYFRFRNKKYICYKIMILHLSLQLVWILCL